MARKGDGGRAESIADSTLPPERRFLNDLGTQLIAAAREAKKVKEDARNGVDRCPERTAALDIPSSEAHHAARQERLRIGAPVGHRAVGNWSQDAPVNGKRVRSSNNPAHGRFNLLGAIEVLEEQGFSPMHAIVSVLKGEPDPDRPGQMMYRADPDTRLKTATELLKYVYPTKKAIEVKDTTPPRGEEIDRRLGELLGKYASILGPDGALPPALLDAAREVMGYDPEDGDEEAPFDPDDDAAPFDPRSML